MISSKTISRPIELEGGVDAAFIWLTIDSSSRFWNETYAPEFSGTGGDSKKAYQALKHHQESAGKLGRFPAERWKAFCDGLGWTPLGCSLWSWCEGVDLESLLEAVRCLEWQPGVLPGEDFAALLMNPAVLPANRLSEIFRVGRDTRAICVILASRVEPPEPDVDPKVLSAVPNILKHMLVARGMDLD